MSATGAGRYLTVGDAVRAYYTFRVTSLVLFIGSWAGLAVVARHLGAGVEILLSVGLVTVIVAMTPLGNFLTLFTAWAGYAISSCPFCPLVHTKPIRVTTETCENCDATVHAVTVGDRVGGWTYKHRDDGDLPFCSYECSTAWEDTQ